MPCSLFSLPALTMDGARVQFGQFVDKKLLFPFPVGVSGQCRDSGAYSDAKQKPQHKIFPPSPAYKDYYAYPAAGYMHGRCSLLAGGTLFFTRNTIRGMGDNNWV